MNLRAHRYIYLNFLYSTVTWKWKWLFMSGCYCVAQKCYVVPRWPKCIHVTGDVLGMNGLQVTASGLEISGLSRHEAMYMFQAFRYVGQLSLHVRGTRSPSNLHGVISPKHKFSLRKYTVTWPPASVHLCSYCSSEHPDYSHCALCHSRTQQAENSSHKQESGSQKYATLAPPPPIPHQKQPDGCHM